MNLLREVAQELEKKGYQTTIHEIAKVNGTKEGLSVTPISGNIAPTFYEDHFEMMEADGLSIQEMADKVINVTEHGSPELGDFSQNLTDKDYLLSNATLCVCNEGWNEEFLQNTPHFHINGTDLSAYARIRVGDDGSMVPSHTHLAMAQVTGDELLEAAKANSKEEYRVRPMRDVLQEIMGEDFPLPPQPQEAIPMIVISNASTHYGAAAITDNEALEKARGMAGGGDCYVIPSSIHECLVIPAKEISAEEMAYLIQDINAHEVQPEERLGSYPYKYDGENLSEMKTKTQEQERAGRGR